MDESGWAVAVELDDAHPAGSVPVNDGGRHGEVVLELDPLLST